MTPLHFGELPTNPAVLEQIQRAHLLGFRTILWPDYMHLSGLGLDPDDYATALEPVFICDLA